MGLAMLFVLVAIVGLTVLRDSDQRAAELVQLQRKIAAFRQLQHNTTEHIIAEAGTATELISLHGSPLWQLYEWMVGLAHIQNMARHWDEELTDEITEMQVSLDAAVASFLMGSALSDSQLRLNASQTRLDIFSTLFQSLGYYALLDPDPELSANEPVPFRRERYYLGQLRRMIVRNEMLQLDKLYERALSNDGD